MEGDKLDYNKVYQEFGGKRLSASYKITCKKY